MKKKSKKKNEKGYLSFVKGMKKAFKDFLKKGSR